MRWFSSAILLVLSDQLLGTVVAVSTCSSALYQVFQALKSYPAAVQYCSSEYPVAVPTCTTSATKTNTITTTAIITVASSTTTFTVTSGTPGTATITDTIIPLDVTSTEIETETVTSTSTIYNNQKRAVVAVTTVPAAFASLTKAAASIIKTACSCIETTPACTTSTQTSTTSTTSTSTSTVFTLASTTTTVPNTQTSTETILTTLPPATTAVTTTSTTTLMATVSAISAPRCDPSQTYPSTFDNGGGCQNGCYCDAAAGNGFAYCVDDSSSRSGCSSDADCPAGEFCDASVGYICNAGKSCTSSYVAPGSAKRDLFGYMAPSRLVSMRKREINKDGPHWKALEAAGLVKDGVIQA